MKIKENKEAIDIPGVNIKRFSYTDYNLTIKRAKTPNGKGNRKIILANYITSNQALKSGNVPTTAVGYTRSNSIEYVLDLLD